MALIYESIYKKLLKLAPNLWTMKPGDALKSTLGAPMMDLNLEVLSKNKKIIIIALARYYKQCGDMNSADPYMEICINSLKMAEVVAYQDSFGYQKVYAYNENFNYTVRRKKLLNNYLNHWLANCLFQGHKLLPYK